MTITRPHKEIKLWSSRVVVKGEPVVDVGSKDGSNGSNAASTASTIPERDQTHLHVSPSYKRVEEPSQFCPVDIVPLQGCYMRSHWVYIPVRAFCILWWQPHQFGCQSTEP